VLFWTRNEPFIEAIAQRVKAVLARQPDYSPERVTESLRLPEDRIRELLSDSAHVIDRSFLLDVVTALVYECGVDPVWLLTGEYDGALHRQALLLGEDRTSEGRRAIHELVHSEYRRARHPRLFPFTLPTLARGQRVSGRGQR